MIEAGQDVLDAEHGVRARDLAPAARIVCRTKESRRRLCLRERIDAALTVEPVDLHERGRIALPDALHFERAAQALHATPQCTRLCLTARGPDRQQLLACRPTLARGPRP